MTVPLARKNIIDYVSLITRQRISAEVSTNLTDANALETARLGRAICKQVVEKQKLDKKIKKQAEQAAVTGASYISCTWRTDKGVPYANNEDGTQVYSGDVSLNTHDFNDVYYDWLVDFDECDWIVIRTKKNRWNLIVSAFKYKHKYLLRKQFQEVTVKKRLLLKHQ